MEREGDGFFAGFVGAAFALVDGEGGEGAAGVELEEGEVVEEDADEVCEVAGGFALALDGLVDFGDDDFGAVAAQGSFCVEGVGVGLASLEVVEPDEGLFFGLIDDVPCGEDVGAVFLAAVNDGAGADLDAEPADVLVQADDGREAFGGGAGLAWPLADGGGSGGEVGAAGEGEDEERRALFGCCSVVHDRRVVSLGRG